MSDFEGLSVNNTRSDTTGTTDTNTVTLDPSSVRPTPERQKNPNAVAAGRLGGLARGRKYQSMRERKLRAREGRFRAQTTPKTANEWKPDHAQYSSYALQRDNNDHIVVRPSMVLYMLDGMQVLKAI